MGLALCYRIRRGRWHCFELEQLGVTLAQMLSNNGVYKQEDVILPLSRINAIIMTITGLDKMRLTVIVGRKYST